MEDLIHTKLSIISFAGEITRSLRVLPIKLTVGTQTTLIAFFMVESSLSYNNLLGKDWIHSNCYVPSLLHKLLMMWHRDDVEIVWANNKLSKH